VATVIVLYANDHVGRVMAGPGIRYTALARELAKSGNEVVLAVPFPSDLSIPGVDVVYVGGSRHRELTRIALRADAVFAQRLPLPTAVRLARSSVRVVYDLYAPTVIENVTVAALSAPRGFERVRRRNTAALEVALATGDAFACASERQRDFWLGALAVAGRLEPAVRRTDPTFRSLIDVVPFGIEAEPPPKGPPVMRGVVPGIRPDDSILLWLGGVWDWVDPLTPIRAVHALRDRRPDLRLFFLGLTSPNEGAERPVMVERTIALARDLGVEGKSVFFNHGWVPFDERGRYLGEANVGVSGHVDDLETRFAYRSRLLDCLWGRLPIVTTGGDVLGDLVSNRGLGRVVAAGDVDSWVEAIEAMLDPAEAAATRRRMENVAAELSWQRAAAALEQLLTSPNRTPRRLARGALAAAEYSRLRLFGIRGRDPALGVRTHPRRLPSLSPYPSAFATTFSRRLRRVFSTR
jgi:hypothetical protein